MTLTITLTTILNLFATNPDLCADVYLDATGEPMTDALGQTLSRYCELAGPDAPIFDSDACCTIDHDGAHCSLPDPNGRCGVGLAMWCEYGEALGDAVVCYQPLPSACDHGYCDSGEVPLEIGAPPWEGSVCCINGVCTEIESGAQAMACIDSDGYMFWCEFGYQQTDGTVDCLDETW